MKKRTCLMFGLFLSMMTSCEVPPQAEAPSGGGGAGVPAQVVMSALASQVPFVNPSTGATETDPGFLFDPTSQYLAVHHLLVSADFTAVYPNIPTGTLTVQPDNKYMGFYGHVDLGGYGPWSPMHSRVSVRSNEPPAETNGVGLTGGLFSLITADVAEARFSNPSIGETNLTASCGGFLSFGTNSGDGGNGNICYDHVTDMAIDRNHNVVVYHGIQMLEGLRPIVSGNMTAAMAECPNTAAILQQLLAVLSRSQQLKLITDGTQQ